MVSARRSPVGAAYGRDPVAREQLIIENLPLVHHVVGRLAIGFPSVFDREDLVAHGVIGLIQAIDRFDPTQGVPFGAWASIRIRGAVLDAIRALDIMSPSARQKVRALQAATNQLTTSLGRFPTDDEVQTALGVSRQDFSNTMEAAGCQIVSLDAATAIEGSPLADLIFSRATEDPSERGAVLAMIAEALRQLDERERLVLGMYYVEDLTLQEIANVIGVHKTVVVRIHSRCIIKLRALMEVTEVEPTSPEEGANDSRNISKADNITVFPTIIRDADGVPAGDTGLSGVSQSSASRRYASAGSSQLFGWRVDLGAEGG